MLEKPSLPIHFIHDLLNDVFFVDLFFDAAHVDPSLSKEYLDAAEVLFTNTLWFTKLIIGAKDNGGKISPEDNAVFSEKLLASLRAMSTLGFIIH